MINPLKGKKFLITAGPTWVPIDDVRVLSNISSGELGMLLAHHAVAAGASVDLLLGPVSLPCRQAGRPVAAEKKLRLTRFTYFHELMGLIASKLKMGKYDYILHCAAVSDYLAQAVRGKISSEKNELVLRLKRAPKLVEMMRSMAPEAFLVMFKLEGGVTDAVLLKRALEAKQRVGADLVIANRFVGSAYRGFILGSKDILAKTVSKAALAKELFRVLKTQKLPLR